VIFYIDNIQRKIKYMLNIISDTHSEPAIADSKVVFYNSKRTGQTITNYAAQRRDICFSSSEGIFCEEAV